MKSLEKIDLAQLDPEIIEQIKQEIRTGKLTTTHLAQPAPLNHKSNIPVLSTTLKEESPQPVEIHPELLSLMKTLRESQDDAFQKWYQGRELLLEKYKKVLEHAVADGVTVETLTSLHGEAEDELRKLDLAIHCDIGRTIADQTKTLIDAGLTGLRPLPSSPDDFTYNSRVIQKIILNFF